MLKTLGNGFSSQIVCYYLPCEQNNEVESILVNDRDPFEKAQQHLYVIVQTLKVKCLVRGSLAKLRWKNFFGGGDNKMGNFKQTLT